MRELLIVGRYSRFSKRLAPTLDKCYIVCYTHKMMKKYRNRAQENSRLIRIPLTTYIELRQLAIKAQVSIGVVVDALAKLEAVEEKQQAVTKATPEQMRLPAVSFEPKIISSNGTTHIKLKSIQ